MSIKDEIKIKSIRDIGAQAYVKPDPKKVESQINALKGNEEAWEYLTERGLTKETIDHFKLGYDYQRHAISIPIFKSGEVVSIKYRNLKKGGPKYGAEASCESWLFNEEGLVGAKEVVVTEGEFDAMSVWQAGYKNVVSPAQGKNSYTVWIERLDAVPKVVIAYDNDEAGKEEASRFADKVGIEKSYELVYPEGIKDANEFFQQKDIAEFKRLLKEAKPFYTYEYKGLTEVIDAIRSNPGNYIEYYCVPGVKFEEDWLTVISGVTNVGKTSYAMNIVKETADNNSPVLVLPFERGIRAVGQRFLQLEFELTKDEIENLSDEQWEQYLNKVKDKPVFFAYPKREDVLATIEKSHRLFGTDTVIIDHFDYMVRNSNKNKEQDISDTLYALKELQMKKRIRVFAVHHIGKQDMKGRVVPPKPHMNDLKGSSSLFQDPEVVIMLSAENLSSITVDVQKNKGPMADKEYGIDVATGKMTEPDDF